MSNLTRINKATSELDKAEERLLYSLSLTDELVERNGPVYIRAVR